MRSLLTILFLVTFFIVNAQITDDFQDGDFTSNPTWVSSDLSGNGADFQVNGGELQSFGPAATTQLSITTPGIPNLTSFDVTWQFKARYTSAPSSSNKIEVFLLSNNPDLNAAPEGYFIRMGETGSDDGIDFYKTSSGTTLIVDANPSVAAGINVNIKVTRLTDGTWTIEADPTGGTSFTTIGSINDTEFTTGPNFGFRVYHTSTKNQDFFFDDVSVIQTGVDTTPPSLNALQVSGSNQLLLTFSEDLNQTSTETTTNYSLNNGVGTPLTAVLSPANQVTLTFSNDFANGEYTLTVTNIDDLNANTLLSTTSDFTIFVPDEPVLRDVIINELMADPTPAVGLPDAEFVELFNSSSKTFDLKDWTFSDASSTVGLSTFILQPDSYVILCSSSNVSLFQPYGDVIGISSLPSLNNSGDDLSIKDNLGNLVDKVSYSSSWYKDEDKQVGGYSLELINPNNGCGGSENWIASNDVSGGTPGKINFVNDPTTGTSLPTLLEAIIINNMQVELHFSETLDSTTVDLVDFSINPSLTISTINQSNNIITLDLSTPIIEAQTYTVTAETLNDCTGNTIDGNNAAEFILIVNPPIELRDIIINEIMSIPSPVAGLPDAEFVELFNNSSKTFDLKDWTFSDASSTVPLATFILQPDSYVILCSSSNVSLFQPFGDVIGISSFPTLNNSGDDLSLKDNIGNLVDEVSYSSSWYKDEDKQGGGYSLELINPNNVCGGSENWIASNDASGGTPGEINSVNDISIGSEMPDLVEVRAINELEVELLFSERLDSTSISLSDFQIDQEITVTSFLLDNDKVTLLLGTPLTASQNYTVTVNGLSDCTSNVLSEQSDNFILIVNPTINEKDIIFNELMPNPSEETSAPNAEFVELYNRSDKTFNLQGWKITDGSSVGELPFYIFYPNTYAILTSVKEASKFDATLDIIGLTNWPSLNNAGDALSLYSNSSYRVDTVNYTSSWYRSSIKDDGGYSLELIDPDNICADAGNWIASEDESGATPGLVNSVLSEIPDNMGPVILNAFGISADTLVVNFDEKLDPASAINANYQLSGGLVLNHVAIGSTNSLYLIIDQTTPLISGQEYSLTITNLFDCPGNFISENTNSVSFALLELAEPGDLLINEILFNPRPNAVDFVEIYNNSNKHISLKNWQLANGTRDNDSITIGTSRVISVDNLIIGPGEYRVFTSDPIILKDQYPKGVEINFVTMSIPSYSDTEGIVILMKDSVYDHFEYSDDLHSEILSNTEGISLERISFSEATSDPNNWISAVSGVGFATPGYINSQTRAIIGTVMGAITIEPKVIIPDGSGQNEFVTISYAFDQSGNVANVWIMDLYGREIKRIAANDYLGQSGFYTWDGSDENGNPVRIGYYIVYVEVFEHSGEVRKYKEKVVIGSRF